MNMRNPPFLLNFWSRIDFELVTGSLNPVRSHSFFTLHSSIFGKALQWYGYKGYKTISKCKILITSRKKLQCLLLMMNNLNSNGIRKNNAYICNKLKSQVLGSVTTRVIHRTRYIIKTVFSLHHNPHLEQNL
jgi:hypothetical protein